MIAREMRLMPPLNKQVCMFVSGVANSLCTRQEEFDRERHLLNETMASIDEEVCLVYFSTLARDISKLQIPYFEHKLAMENIIATHPNHLILRVGQVVGMSPNRAQLLNFYSIKFPRKNILFFGKVSLAI